MNKNERSKTEIPLKPKKLPKKDYKEFCTILRECLGMITHACKKYGCSRQTYWFRYNEDPVFREMVDDVSESMKDFGEAALMKKIKNGDTASIIFFAKTKLKDRGYTERHEIVGRDGAPISSVHASVNIDELEESQRNALLSLAESMVNKKE